MAPGDISAGAGALAAADPGRERWEETLRMALLEPGRVQE